MEKLVKKIFKEPYILVFTLLWILLILVLPWNGFYLLNDSYVYEWNVRNFYLNGFSLHPLTSPTTLFQTFLGSIIYTFSKNPGLLRLLTSIFSLLGAVYFFKLLTVVTKRRTESFLVSLILFFNPLYIYLSFTFMTDIYFISLFIICSYYFLLYLNNTRIKHLYIVSFLLSFLFLTRQTGLLVVLCYFFILKKYKKLSLKSLFIMTFPLAVFVWYQFFYDKPLGYTYQSVEVTFSQLVGFESFLRILSRFIYSLYYVGLFVLPFTTYYGLKELFNLKSTKKTKYIRFGAIFIFAFVVSLYLWFAEKQVMFYIPNILSYAGFNPSSLNDGIKQTFFVESPLRIRALITLLCIYSISVFITYLTERSTLSRLLKSEGFLILLLPTALIFSSSLIFRDFFDRYLLIVLPLILMPIAFYRVGSNLLKKIYILSLVLFGLCGVLLEHDYLNLHKKIWEVSYNSVSHRMLKPENTHATYEYNNYFKLDQSFNITDGKYLFSKKWLNEKGSNKYLLSYTDTWVYCRAERVFYPSFISSYSRTEGYFHIMVKKEEIDGSSCPDQVKEFNIEVYGQ